MKKVIFIMSLLLSLVVVACGSVDNVDIHGNANTNDGGNTDNGNSVKGLLSPALAHFVGTDVSTDNDSGSVDTSDGSTGDDSGSVDDSGDISTPDSSASDDSGDNTGDDSGSNVVDAGNSTGDSGSVCVPNACVYTQGYWKQHSSTWTGVSLTLGGVVYTSAQCLDLLNADPQGDDSVILAKQLIAALLNNGECDPNVSATVQSAQDWMTANNGGSGLPYGITCDDASGSPGCVAWSLGQTLDSYNSGNSGTPHCQ